MKVKNMLLQILLKEKNKDPRECLLPLILPIGIDLDMLNILIGTKIKAHYEEEKAKVDISGKLVHIISVADSNNNTCTDRNAHTPSCIYGIFEQIVELTSEETATTLARKYGGIRIYIPQKAKSNHPLTILIGEKDLQAIIDKIGAGHLLIPAKGHRGARAKARMIISLLDHDISVRNIAILADCCERTVWLHKRQYKEFILNAQA